MQLQERQAGVCTPGDEDPGPGAHAQPQVSSLPWRRLPPTHPQAGAGGQISQARPFPYRAAAVPSCPVLRCGTALLQLQCWAPAWLESVSHARQVLCYLFLTFSARTIHLGARGAVQTGKHLRLAKLLFHNPPGRAGMLFTLTLTRLSTGSHGILIDKPMRYWALMWADSWLNIRAHKIVIHGTKSS